MDPGASSLLLHCLAQLGQDTVTQLLLPKLLEQGSGPALAATCSRLRVLVHSSITRLLLRGFWQDGKPGLTEAWTADLPDHFPSCNHVCLEVPFPAASHSMPYVISALARLPVLDAISIKATFTELPMVALSTVLCCMRTQLTGLKSLTLDLQECSAPGLGCIWQELGRATQLTALDVKLWSPVEDDLDDYLRDVAALSALQGLLVLRLSDECTEAGTSVDWSFVSCLTALTKLALTSSADDEGVTAISSCMALRDLTFYCAGDPPGSAALAQLTGLTRVDLDGQPVEAGSECAQALSCLTHLRWLGAGRWAPGLLPVLQGLPQLSTISGGWDTAASEQQLGSVRLPQVCKLLDTGGSVPLTAFPRLVSLQQHCSWATPPDMLPKLATCCPQLQELHLGSFCAPSLDTTAVTKGLQSLCSLRHLQHLQLQVNDEAQLAAAAPVCMVLAQGSLKTLHVSVSGCRFSSLLVLSKLAGLDVLHVVFHQPTADDQQGQEGVRVEDAGLLLSGLSAVRKVIVCCHDIQVHTALHDAHAWAAKWGLSFPSDVVVLVPGW